MNINIFVSIFPIALLILVIELVRRGRLTFKYAVGWIVISVAAVGLIIFDDVLFDIAHWFGFQLPSNFIFFTLLAFFVFLSLLLTTFLCQQETHNTTVAQRIGMLELELKQLKEKRKD